MNLLVNAILKKPRTAAVARDRYTTRRLVGNIYLREGRNKHKGDKNDI